MKTSPEEPIDDTRWPGAEDPLKALIRRVRAEYWEMPGLCLTVQQACRLWHIDATTCTCILDALVAERLLRRTPAGAFVAAALDPPENSIRRR